MYSSRRFLICEAIKRVYNTFQKHGQRFDHVPTVYLQSKSETFSKDFCKMSNYFQFLSFR